MKKVATLALVCTLLVACKDTTEKKENLTNAPNSNIAVSETKPLPSSDYSSLFINYECDMDVAEVAKVMDIPETDISLSEYKQAGRCDFILNGFGKNAAGGTAMMWGATPFSKADSKKEIQSALKDKENNENIFGMDIELSETRDCYIRILPHVGRVIIYNENYDHAFFFSYSQSGIYKRSEEQHKELTKKTIALANYLLKKHKK